MNFTQALAQQQSRVNAAREHYCECRDKLHHLIDQIVAADPWDTKTIAELNLAIGLAEYEEKEAWKVWDIEIAAIASIPTDTATFGEWEEARSLMPKGYRIKDGWFYDAHGGRCSIPPVALTERQVNILTGKIAVTSEPMDDFYQNNDEPTLFYDELDEPDVVVGSEEITVCVDGKCFTHYYDADTEF